ncbi:hypothetical protein DL96DRAFT_1461048 [Flagelloscypha sp. PMI_526]|nr:hypothetical protein DL96DRAFT_1461048 [Flagelloscypha sp. PMI_526]
MGKTAKKLKSALQSTQSRLHNKSQTKAKDAARATVAKAKAKSYSRPKVNKGKGKERPMDDHFIFPFLPGDAILLIGEGNFSFARALVAYIEEHWQSDQAQSWRICATSYDPEEDCFSKYSDAESIVAQLRATENVEVRFCVDATKLQSTFKERKWDRVAWNFPHTGSGVTDLDRNVRGNQELVLKFLKSVKSVLRSGNMPERQGGKGKRLALKDVDDDSGSDMDQDAENALTNVFTCRGTVLITLRNVPPYTLWDIPRLAKKPPPPASSTAQSNPKYRQLRSFPFQRDVWAKYGYSHRMTKGERGMGGLATTGVGGEDRTWEFCLQDD